MRETKRTEKSAKYEAPRLTTYGKLASLTKGTTLSGTDNAVFKPGA